jgi:hypothetical protein
MFFKKNKVKVWQHWTVKAVGEESRALVWFALSANKILWTMKSTTEFETGKAPVTTYEFICTGCDEEIKEKFYATLRTLQNGYESEMEFGSTL